MKRSSQPKMVTESHEGVDLIFLRHNGIHYLDHAVRICKTHGATGSVKYPNTPEAFQSMFDTPYTNRDDAYTMFTASLMEFQLPCCTEAGAYEQTLTPVSEEPTEGEPNEGAN